ncbi:HAMP domain-containing protein [Aquincola sp. S2]|uniref:HAMP domain-containing protein n=1 Tax=Pseudaquabacterium terrae TaxID=2732868 RepID=A0ABX2E953_9BURK|nr:HAMP domain-containing protein [Aquabacterium terrae]
MRLPFRLPFPPFPRFTLLLRLRLAQRLALGFGLVLALLAVLLGVALMTMDRMAARTTVIVEVQNQRIALAGEMIRAVDEVSITLRNLVLIPWVDELPSEVTRMKKALSRYDAARRAFIALAGNEATDATVAKHLAALELAERDARPIGEQVAQLALADKKDDATTLVTLELRQVQSAWVAQIDELRAREVARSTQAQAFSQRAYRSAAGGLLGLSLLALLIGGAAAWSISRSVTRPIAQAVAVAERIAGGDLSVPIVSTARDETGQLLAALARMQAALAALVGEVRGTTDHVAGASREMAGGSRDLSQRTELAAARLQHTASTTQQLAGALGASARTAQEAHALASGASQVALRGGEAMRSVMGRMATISTSSRRIADISGVIDAIAFQTHLLALNAAVEAARAGDAGRGFAVVAGEVRELAQRCGQAAQQIKGLTEDSAGEVRAGLQTAEQARATMDHIVAAVERVLAGVGTISTAAQQQSAGLADVSRAVNELDQMTQQNAALVEQTAAAAAALQEQADRLGDRVAVFRTNAP